MSSLGATASVDLHGDRIGTNGDSYTHRRKYRTGIEGNPRDRIFQQPSGALAAAVTYTTLDGVSLLFEITHLPRDSAVASNGGGEGYEIATSWKC